MAPTDRSYPYMDTYGNVVRHPDPAMSAAMEEAFRGHPYYRSAIAGLRITADPNVPTMATSKDWVTHYNPTFLAGLTAEQAGAVLVHEVEHLLRRHFDRCEDRDPGRFNIAGDAEINQRLANLPDGAVYPESIGMPRGRTAEVYYAATAPNEAPKPEGDGSGSGEGDGSGGGGGGKPGAGTAQCGSAAGGPTQPHEAGDAANPGAGKGADDGASTRAEAARAVLGSGRGTGVSDDLREWAETELQIDRAGWYTALASVVGRSVAPHTAPTRWVWPGRRDYRDMGGAVLPRWTGERPDVAVVIDTSGSISDFDLEMARAAGTFLARAANATFYACNHAATLIGRHLPDTIRGSGGTDMSAGIARAIADGARTVVVITDCETPWPWVEPDGVAVIVGANPNAGRYLARIPSWMTVVAVGAR